MRVVHNDALRMQIVYMLDGPIIFVSILVKQWHPWLLLFEGNATISITSTERMNLSLSTKPLFTQTKWLQKGFLCSGVLQT